MLLELLLFALLGMVGYMLYKQYIEPKDTKIDSSVNAKILSEVSGLKVKVELIEKNREKLDEDRQKREEKNLTMLQDFMRTVSGTKRRGCVGENLLKSILNIPIKAGAVRTNLNVDGKSVEFAWNLGDGKYIPIDSKLPEVTEIYKKYSGTEDISEQKKLKDELIKKIKKHITEVKKYQNKHNTIDSCVLALPDAIVDMIPEVASDFKRTKVLVCGYGHVLFFLYILAEQYHKSIESGDIGEYRDIIENLIELLREVKTKTESIDRGITIIDNANRDIKGQTIQGERYRVTKSKKKQIIEEITK